MKIDIWVQSAGIGHVTRQVNFVQQLLANELTSQAEILFYTDDTPGIQGILDENGLAYEVRPADMRAAADFVLNHWSANPPDIFVLDTVDHDRNPPIAALLQSTALVSVAVIDDPFNRAVKADLVVNPLPTLTNAPPPVSDNTRYLLGKDYFIQAPEFAAGHSVSRDFSAPARNGFAFFGGQDGWNLSGMFLKSVPMIVGVNWVLQLGPLYPYASYLQEEIIAKQLPVEITRRSASFAQTLSQADVVVAAGGNTLIDAATVGTPTVVICQNAIQRVNASYFVEQCGLPCLGELGDFTAQQLADAINHLVASRPLRQQLSDRFKATVDGQGAQRVAQELADVCQRKLGV
jgi:spore coat polysaccharide biosynthesis predicted glycosyltransferase SpsG